MLTHVHFPPDPGQFLGIPSHSEPFRTWKYFFLTKNRFSASPLTSREKLQFLHLHAANCGYYRRIALRSFRPELQLVARPSTFGFARSLAPETSALNHESGRALWDTAPEGSRQTERPIPIGRVSGFDRPPARLESGAPGAVRLRPIAPSALGIDFRWPTPRALPWAGMNMEAFGVPRWLHGAA